MKTIGFIGGGRITRILLQAFKHANVSFEKIYIYETNETVLNALKSKYHHIEASSVDITQAASSELIFIALHPPVLMESLEKFKHYIKKNALLVSLAPKITIEKLRAVLPQIPNIARMNPNAGTYVNKGFNPVCFASSIDTTIKNEFVELFKKLGKIPVVSENQIEAYAVISAMGHTYFWFQLQQLKELACSFGLSEKEAQETITSMMSGTIETLFNSGLSYEEVTNLVPAKPMAEYETIIKDYYKKNLNGIYQKIKP
jgi:pyrroline-5-carboxylate reductase